MGEDTMLCPECSAEIKAAARVCRFCGADLSEGVAPVVAIPPEASPQPAPPQAVPQATPVGAPPVADFTLKAGGIPFSIEPRFRVEGGTVTFMAKVITDEGRRKRWLWLTPMLVMILGLVACVGVLATMLDQSDPPVFWLAALAVTFVLFIVSAVVAAVGQSVNVKRHNQPYAITFPITAIGHFSVAYDWNSGCAFMILFALLPGLIIMLAMGKRILKIRAPLESGKPARTYRFIARPADAAALRAALTMQRASVPASG